MKIINVKQGTEEWLEARKRCCTASEAPVVMGSSKYISRDELIKQKATGVTPEFPDSVKKLFADGHRTESMARPIVEEMIGESLYPVVAVHDTEQHILASFDGITMMEDTIFEHKLWNEKLAEEVRNNELSEHYYWQLEQQLFVSGAEKVVFVVSDGTTEKFESMEYRPVAGRIDKLLRGWEQFRIDCEAYSPTSPSVEIIPDTIESLPVIAVNVTGSLAVKSNLVQFERQAMDFIGGIKTELSTDKDFADADAMVKFCSKTEKDLDAVKKDVLAQVSDVDAALSMIDRVKGELRTRRLTLSKRVKTQKESVRDNIIITASNELRNHVEKLQQRIGNAVMLPSSKVDFSAAIKGKRTITSLKSAANDALAKAKIEASETADFIEFNINALKQVADNHMFLLADLQSLILFDTEKLLAIAKSRIAEHEAAQEAAARIAAERERERIRAEEREAAAREAAAKELVNEAEESNIDAWCRKWGVCSEAKSELLAII